MTTEKDSSIEILTEREVPSLPKCTVPGLKRMRCEKRGPRWCRVGRLVRYSVRWVEEWLAENEAG